MDLVFSYFVQILTFNFLSIVLKGTVWIVKKMFYELFFSKGKDFFKGKGLRLISEKI
jgi:hypothetical protein